MKRADLEGKRIKRLIVTSYAGSNKRGSALWHCLCDCGNTTIVSSRSLITQHTGSCGCYGREARLKSITTHNASNTPEYSTWGGMRDRCKNKSHTAYKNYGGRGIKVCDRWKEFRNFLADMGKKPSPEHCLDRIDNDGNYEPGNCRWATRAEQNMNKRIVADVCCPKCGNIFDVLTRKRRE